MKLAPFEFFAPNTGYKSIKVFYLVVPAGIQSKEELLSALAGAGGFPDYFGHNWDALSDCMRDFGWIQEKMIVIAHSDLPLRNSPVDCRVYLEILRDVADDWKQIGKQAIEIADSSKLTVRELQVVFPLAERLTIADHLGETYY